MYITRDIFFELADKSHIPRDDSETLWEKMEKKFGVDNTEDIKTSGKVRHTILWIPGRIVADRISKVDPIKGGHRFTFLHDRNSLPQQLIGQRLTHLVILHHDLDELARYLIMASTLEVRFVELVLFSRQDITRDTMKAHLAPHSVLLFEGGIDAALRSLAQSLKVAPHDRNARGFNYTLTAEQLKSKLQPPALRGPAKRKSTSSSPDLFSHPMMHSETHAAPHPQSRQYQDHFSRNLPYNNHGSHPIGGLVERRVHPLSGNRGSSGLTLQGNLLLDRDRTANGNFFHLRHNESPYDQQLADAEPLQNAINTSLGNNNVSQTGSFYTNHRGGSTNITTQSGHLGSNTGLPPGIPGHSSQQQHPTTSGNLKIPSGTSENDGLLSNDLRPAPLPDTRHQFPGLASNFNPHSAQILATQGNFQLPPRFVDTGVHLHNGTYQQAMAAISNNQPYNGNPTYPALSPVSREAQPNGNAQIRTHTIPVGLIVDHPPNPNITFAQDDPNATPSNFLDNSISSNIHGHIGPPSQADHSIDASQLLNESSTENSSLTKPSTSKEDTQKKARKRRSKELEEDKPDPVLEITKEGYMKATYAFKKGTKEEVYRVDTKVHPQASCDQPTIQQCFSYHYQCWKRIRKYN